MNIKKLTGTITNIIDLSKTAKEVQIKLSESAGFIPGSFLNVFLNINGEKVRRAYSISSSSKDQNNISFTIRLSPEGTMSPLFWKKDMIGENLELMGPLGLNTVDKMIKPNIYLFAFGIGIGVVKSIADYFINQKKVDSVTIVTGSRSVDEILYKEYFDNLRNKNSNVLVSNVVSQAVEGQNILRGYIQDHIGGFNFDNSSVYVCGQEKACNDLVEKIKTTNPVGCEFFIEGFH